MIQALCALTRWLLPATRSRRRAPSSPDKSESARVAGRKLLSSSFECDLNDLVSHFSVFNKYWFSFFRFSSSSCSTSEASIPHKQTRFSVATFSKIEINSRHFRFKLQFCSSILLSLAKISPLYRSIKTRAKSALSGKC